MKLIIKLIFIFLIYALPALASSNFLDAQLKAAALRNGYKVPTAVNSTFDKELAKLGEAFFNSEELSFNGNTSCSTCHLEKFSSSDGIPNAIGVGGSGEGFHRLQGRGALVPRNTLPLWGRASKDFKMFFWDGKVERSNGKIISQFGSSAPSQDALTVAIHLPFVEIREMVVDDSFVDENLKTETLGSAFKIQNELLNRVKSDLKLAQSLAKLNSVTLSELKFIHVAEAIRHFFAKNFRLQSTRFSEFIENNGKLSHEELNGGIIFYGKGMCSSCHSGPHFSDFKTHTIAYPQAGPGKNGFGSDYGRFNFTLQFEDLNKFRTPPLHNVEKTGPYGHSGSVFSLREAIVGHYDPFSLYDFDLMSSLQRRELFQKLISIPEQQATPSHLSEKELSNLIAFLKSLSF
jgi:cytochrome c peroxidase